MSWFRTQHDYKYIPFFVEEDFSYKDSKMLEVKSLILTLRSVCTKQDLYIPPPAQVHCAQKGNLLQSFCSNVPVWVAGLA
jgi:hypothetical protein